MRALLWISILIPSFSFLTQGQDIGGNINIYAQVFSITSTPDCNTVITVNSSTGFSVGDYVIMIQMKGAVISTANDTNYDYGTIIDLASVGNFEKKRISAIAGNDLTLFGPLGLTYNPATSLQIVNVPQYANANVTTTLTAPAWDGTSGGVLALEVSGTLTLNSDIDLSGKGYRGGIPYFYTGTNTCAWWNPRAEMIYDISGFGGGKGEGIAYMLPNFICGRGPQGNGGGGGNDHNSGGGGGSSLVAGGVGGINDEPGTFNCQGDYPGFGGYPINQPQGLFLGGAGGAGHANNNLTGIGGNGGGIIILYCSQLDGNGFSILSNGENGGIGNGDGGGGGAGGGGIMIDCPNINGSLTISATGGNGGNTVNSATGGDRCFGPGGGAGGGYLLTNSNLTGVTTDFSGGTAGIITLSINGCNGSTSGAQNGADGSIYPLPTITSYVLEGYNFAR